MSDPAENIATGNPTIDLAQTVGNKKAVTLDFLDQVHYVPAVPLDENNIPDLDFMGVCYRREGESLAVLYSCTHRGKVAAV